MRWAGGGAKPTCLPRGRSRSGPALLPVKGDDMLNKLAIGVIGMLLALTLVFSIIGAVRDRPARSPVAQVEQFANEVNAERMAIQKTLSTLHQLSDEVDMVPVITHANDPCQEDEALWWVEPGRRDCVAIDTICGN